MCYALAEIWDAVAVFSKFDVVAGLNPFSGDASGEPPSPIERDDGELVRRICNELLGRCKHDRLGVDYARSGMSRLAHARLSTVTTAVAPEPPRFWANPSEWRATCRSPASPRSCTATSQI